MSRLEVRVPDLGGAQGVDVVEVLVAPGATVEREDALISLSSDKASMDIPCPAAGTVLEVLVRRGDKVEEGTLIAVLEVVESAAAATADAVPLPSAQAPAANSSTAIAATPTLAAPDPAASAPAALAEPAAAPRAPRPAADSSCDLLVLGGGPGGYAAAFRAADLGLDVVLVERYPVLGGVCLNVGCIPSKALLHAARVIDEAAALGAHGVEFGAPRIDLDRLRAFKDGVVQRLSTGLSGLAKKRHVRVVQGVGSLASDRLLAVELAAGGRQTIAFDQAILAAGSRVLELPGMPPGDARVWDSTSALELPSIPRRLLIVGGGIIGLEMATVYGALGSEITIVELTPTLIPGCDRDLVKPLERRLRERLQARIHLGIKVAEVSPESEGLRVTFAAEAGAAAPEPQLCDVVLVATGRRPNGDRIGADAAGVLVDRRGFVPVDRQQRTNVPNLFAIGDLAGQPMLAHKATHEGRVAAEVAAGKKSSNDARVIPSVAYTDPEVAWVGLTETEARAQGIAHERGAFPWSASGRALGLGREEGTTKLLFDPATRRLLGAGIVGVNAGDLIAEAALAIEMGCEAADLALTVHPHPTLSETLALAAEAFEGTLTDLYVPKSDRGSAA
jgi:dihydrolipoamide dehydrogenase